MNTYGKLFRVSIFGESHGPAVGVMVDGCPPGMPLAEDDLSRDLDRRRAGARGTTPRKEYDLPDLISGVYNGYTTGAPLLILTRNTNIKSSDYLKLKDSPRPGHADFTALKKYLGYSDPRGGGHFSGRLTWGLVAAGTVARKVLGNVEITATLVEAGGSENIGESIERALSEGDSVGGIIECSVKNVPAGLGEPFFSSVESEISKLVFSIPAIKGIEFGSGFAAASMRGSDHNDVFIDTDGTTETNNAGGINGGITSGNEVYFRVAVKPTSSISKEQKTFNLKKNKISSLQIEGRHDACIALRMPVIVESAAAIALADLMLQDRGIYAERKS
jgi:chorismate synthase